MCSPVVAGSDCTELEAMAIPSSDTSTHQMKKEALLSNLHHRFKKDQIYVSNIIEMGKNTVLKIMMHVSIYPSYNDYDNFKILISFEENLNEPYTSIAVL